MLPKHDREGKCLRPPKHKLIAAFNRYDLDLSGTMNSTHELLQFVTNLLVTCETGTQVDQIESMVLTSGCNADNPWPFEQVCEWTFATYTEFSPMSVKDFVAAELARLNNELCEAQDKLMDSNDLAIHERTKELDAKIQETVAQRKEIEKLDKEAEDDLQKRQEKKKRSDEARAKLLSSPSTPKSRRSTPRSTPQSTPRDSLSPGMFSPPGIVGIPTDSLEVAELRSEITLLTRASKQMEVKAVREADLARKAEAALKREQENRRNLMQNFNKDTAKMEGAHQQEMLALQETHRAQILEYEVRLQQAEGTAAKAKSNVQSLEAKTVMAVDENDTVSRLRAMVEKLNAEAQENQMEVLMARGSQRVIDQLTEEQEKTAVSNAKTKAALREAHQKIHEMQIEVFDTRATLGEAKQSVKAAERTSAMLANQKILNQELEKAQAELIRKRKLEAEKIEKEAQIAEKMGHSEKLQAANKKRLAILNSEVMALQTRIMELETKSLMLQGKVESLTPANAELRASCQALINEVNEARKLSLEHDQVVKAKTELVEVEKTRVGKLRAQNEAIFDQLSASNNEVKELTVRLQKVQQKTLE